MKFSNEFFVCPVFRYDDCPETKEKVIVRDVTNVASCQDKNFYKDEKPTLVEGRHLFLNVSF